MLQSTQAGGLSLSALPSLMLLYGYKVTYATTFKAVSGAKRSSPCWVLSIYEVRKTLPGATQKNLLYVSLARLGPLSTVRPITGKGEWNEHDWLRTILINSLPPYPHPHHTHRAGHCLLEQSISFSPTDRNKIRDLLATERTEIILCVSKINVSHSEYMESHWWTTH